jgi:hypothetical protein
MPIATPLRRAFLGDDIGQLMAGAAALGGMPDQSRSIITSSAIFFRARSLASM